MNHELLHRKIVDNCEQVQSWFKAKSTGLAFPFYSSFDLRDAGFKLGPVDANIFPAGFNNICRVDRDNSMEVAKEFLDSHYSTDTRKILLLTEEHTGNPYYWDNVLALQTILQGAGREVRLAVPKPLEAPLQLTSASGTAVTVASAIRNGGGVDIDGFRPDLIISNNDFSLQYEEWAKDLETPMNPPRELGWYRRRKDRFFKVYNEFAGEFADLLKLDPWTLQVETEVFSGFEVDDENSRDQLAAAAQKIYDRVKAKYAAHGISREPFLFVKNNAGTYGLGVIQVRHPDEIKAWNYKARKKMKAAKGGREITEVIIQEGIPTTTLAEGGKTAEPVIYMIGCQLSGGFLRAHGEKADDDSLNSPGAVFQRLCVADLNVKMEGCPMENSYGWVAKLAFLSVAREAKELGVEFKNYRAAGPCS
ncbi:MAG: glutamate--cysteine ligase [Bdellovibrionales bacterium]|nr:glutamate--cysteine ligase [Bdellovibrionales bacterium]